MNDFIAQLTFSDQESPTVGEGNPTRKFNAGRMVAGVLLAGVGGFAAYKLTKKNEAPASESSE